MAYVLLITRLFAKFGWIELHHTHEMFSYDPCSLNYSVVRAIQLDGTTLNSLNIVI